ncbi:hypothetical protein [Xanthomonas maliensis]|uniref:hypothetical protein n=1 Tax=Xanthomonas maliensis TaxID=1321368 RepID=UPI0003A9A3B6|nr:hypothetical protein [Xanthomonas maliensis]KAB7763822.1 hypothetical protein CKY51_18905 [Xanthomonas maliensis]
MSEESPLIDPFTLQAQLRALPRERQPPAELWERIAAGLEANDTPIAVRPQRRRRWTGPAIGLALAAALALVAVLPSPHLPWASPHTPPAPLLTQAQAMGQQYQQAIAAVPLQQAPADLRPALDELDQSAQAIQQALAQSPGSAFLLSQLQRTYAKRLQLTRLASQDAATFSS